VNTEPLQIYEHFCKDICYVACFSKHFGIESFSQSAIRSCPIYGGKNYRIHIRAVHLVWYLLYGTCPRIEREVKEISMQVKILEQFSL